MKTLTARRAFLRTTAGAFLLPLAAAASPFADSAVSIAEFDAAGKPKGIVHVPKIRKTDAEWKQILGNGEAFEVTRHADTEAPFKGKYSESHDDGLYGCACCQTVLFDSKTKFDSGTGWPSFWAPIAKENVTLKSDHTYGERTEVLCTRCDAHLGHVFDDGPKPTGKRYCMNSVSLIFVPRGK